MNENPWFTENAEGYEDVVNYYKNNNEDKCYYNIINYDGINKPHFYDVVLNSEILSKNAKDQFIKKFWIKFSNLKNKKFRENVFGKYLFWINMEFIGYIDCLDDANNYGSYKDDKLSIYIGEKSDTEYISFLNPIIESTDLYVNVFTVPVCITNKCNPKNTDTIHTSNMIIDTGCTTSEYPFLRYWDFEKREFSKTRDDNLKEDLNMLNWNLHKKICNIDTVLTANNNKEIAKLYLNYPLYLKIGNLKPIEMYSFIFPLKKPNTIPKFYLLGLDYICKTKMSIEQECDNIILTLEN